MKIYKACEPNTRTLITPEIEPIAGQWCQVTDSENDKYVKYSQYNPPVPTVVLNTFTTNNESVTVNGNPTELFKSTYYGAELDSINMSFDIVDDQGVLQTQLDSAAKEYPPLLLPILKGDGGETIWFTTTLVLGVATVTGKFKDSSDWKLLTARVNKALAGIGADWMLEKEDVTFMINA